MATAPTPPTKPIPPTVAPVTMTTSTDSPANPAATTGTKVSPETSALGKEIEGLTKAFQGTSTPSSAGDKSSLVPKNESQTTETMKTVPLGFSNSQEGVSTKTAVPANHQVPESKGTYSGYVWFVVVVMIVGAVLIGVRLYRDRDMKKQPRITTANSDRVNAFNDNLAGDLPRTQPAAAKKAAKSSFDFRV